jgi:hypothetical protein
MIKKTNLFTIILKIFNKSIRLLKQFGELNEFAKANHTKFIGNPINCFLILKQLTADIDDLVLKVGKKKSEEFKSKFKNFNFINLID